MYFLQYIYHTYALFVVMAGLKTIIAITAVTSLKVDTVTIPTNFGIGNTLVNITAIICESYLLVTLRTDAHERSNQVLTHEFAVVGRCHTFIHICIKSMSNIVTFIIENR
jgi:hypothetical protein